MEDIQLKDENIAKLSVKMKNQRRMAWTAIIAMIFVTLLCLTPYVPETRVTALGPIMPIFYVCMSGVVGAYMGVTSWMNKK